MTIDTLKTARNDIKNWLERCLIGPFIRPSEQSVDHNEEVLHIRPSELYQCAILYGQLPDTQADEKNDNPSLHQGSHRGNEKSRDGIDGYRRRKDEMESHGAVKEQDGGAVNDPAGGEEIDLQRNFGNDEIEDEGEDGPNNETSEGGSKGQKSAEHAGRPCYYRPPSGVGLSFFVSRDIELNVVVKGARYTKLEPRKEQGAKPSDHPLWQRRPIPDHTADHEEIITLRPPTEARLFEEKIPILSDTRLAQEQNEKPNTQKGAYSGKSSNQRNNGDKGNDDYINHTLHHDILHVKWRPKSDMDGFIVTLSVVNTAMAPDTTWENWEKCHIFQLSFQCHAAQGEIYPYPATDMLQWDADERTFSLLYSDKTIYAIGHGVSPDWTTDRTGRVTTVLASFLPTAEVPLMKTDVAHLNQEILRLATLAETDSKVETIQSKLQDLTASYGQWLAKLTEHEGLTPDQKITAENLLERIERAGERMSSGIEALKDPLVAAAFAMAHHAMIDYMKTRGIDDPLWRPFQLGFLLEVIPSIIDETDPDRDLVDLLWFQTGGGKTEAYLAIISFLIAFRRMRFGDEGAGTTVIMRYTLRLLTIQQFQRAAVVICALERLRRKNPERLGKIPITAGLWVGGASSPNTFYSARQILDSALQSKGHGLERLVITECPWCGTPFEIDENAGKSNFRANLENFNFICTHPACDFGGSDNPVLPINVVDQHLYAHPPTLLLATIDKFAMFAWKPEATVFLGEPFRPPDLIIQDELHLIAGELGTLSGLYEAGFDTVFALKEHKPKYIASTATIRNAKEQIKKLYAREASIFPPPGLNWSDSFFARVDNEKPGRLYIGYAAPKLGRTESFAPLGAALFSAPALWNESDEAIRDAWWTVVAYHGSLRGLGITHNLIGDEVGKYLNIIIHALLDEKNGRMDPLAAAFQDFCATLPSSAPSDHRADNRFGTAPSLLQSPPSPLIRQSEAYKKQITNAFMAYRGLYSESGIAELTSNRNAREIRKYLSDLETGYSHENNRAISLLLCTNMVSVGLDISRLGLMVINGQPFTTGEYIQAGSRVGRNRVPGIVVAHFLRNHARDMSHYENFRAYHESFYRFVEPTSLTPFSAPARQRALHAALVIVMRHGAGLLKNDMANEMNPEDKTIKRAVDLLLARCKTASPDQFRETRAHLDQLMFHWDELSGNDGWDLAPLQYDAPPSRKDKFPLLIKPNDHRWKDGAPGSRDAGGEKKNWMTLQSMRQVDDACGIVFVAPR